MIQDNAGKERRAEKRTNNISVNDSKTYYADFNALRAAKSHSKIE
jgi:hypothetical protein